MAPKTNCTPAKLSAALAYIQKSRVCHTIKDLEKHLPSVAQINGMQVKDYVQALQDESRIRAEKIGSGNWYWSFISDDKIAVQKSLEGAQATYEKALATDNELKAKIAEGEAQRKEDEEMLDESGESREHLLGSKRLLESEIEGLRRELATYSENDPTELERKGREAVEWKGVAEQCTDDIYSMEQWLKDTTGGGEALGAMLREMYGSEWGDEAGGLKELA
ncbi:hypothetical protein Q7P36_009128 [Cladosporium allicinum]